MVVRFTKEEVKDIEYVVVEVALKKEKTNKIKGLFLGCQPMVKVHTQLVANDEEFVWLYKGDNIYMLNAAHYNIEVIELGKGAVKRSTYTAGGTPQSEYIDRLKLIQEVFTSDGKALKSGLIDSDKYIVPQSITSEIEKEGKKEATSTTNKGTVYNRSGGINYGNNHSAARTGTCGYSGYSYTKKDPTTSIIKRTTKYPISAAIDRMRAKVEELREGKYEPPKLPSIPADKKEPVNNTQAASAQDDADDDNFSYMGMM